MVSFEALRLFHMSFCSFCIPNQLVALQIGHEIKHVPNVRTAVCTERWCVIKK